MSRFDRGVEYYTQVMIPVGFPEDNVVCRYCPMCKLRLMQGKAEAVCQATGMILDNVDRRPEECPGVIMKREEDHEQT